MAPGEEAMPSRRGAVLSVVREPVNGTYCFPTNQHFCLPPSISADSAHMHLVSTLAYCALISSLYCGKSTIKHVIFSQLGVIVELYSYLCILAVDRSNVSYLSFCLRILVRSAVCTVYWYI